MLLALLATCTLVTVGTPPAHAETTEQYLRLTWDLTNLDTEDAGQEREDQYRRFIGQLRDAAGSPMAGVDTNDMFDTPRGTRTNRVVEVSVWTINGRGQRGIHHILYFSLDDMYLRGFTINSVNYQFRDDSYAFPLADQVRRARNLATAPLFNQIYDGSYRQLDANQQRGGMPYTPRAMRDRLRELGNFTYNSRNDYRRQLAYIIGATAEAARFGWIRNRIAAVLNHGYDPNYEDYPTTLGNFGMELQTHWSDLSRVAHDTSGGGTSRPVNIDGRTYSNISQIRLGTGGVPPLVPFLALRFHKP
ncbi:ribosome-inactivating family protein [Microbacterium sp. NPDC016588]|nr:hypothetical protein DF18_32310 [Streptomyces rimosus]